MSAGSETHILQMTLQSHLQSLETYTVAPTGLDKARPAPPPLQQEFAGFFSLPACSALLCSASAYTPGGQACKRGDVVLLRKANQEDVVAQVWFHVQFNNVCYSAVTEWPAARALNRFCVTEKPVFVPTLEIYTLCIHRPEGKLALVIPVRQV
jgi:hypothetical protein